MWTFIGTIFRIFKNFLLTFIQFRYYELKDIAKKILETQMTKFLNHFFIGCNHSQVKLLSCC